MQRITPLQLFIFMFNFLYLSGADLVSRQIIRGVGFGGWLSLIWAAPVGLLLTYLAFQLGKRWPNESVVRYGSRIMPRVLHIPIMLLFLFFMLQNSSIQMRHLSDFILQNYLMLTPNWLLSLLMGVCIWFSARAGIENIFRCVIWIVIITYSSIALYPLLLWKDIELGRAFALVTHLHAKSIYVEGLKIVPLYGQLIIIMFLAPYVKNYAKSFRSMVWACFFFCAIMLQDFFLAMCLFGPELAANFTSPGLEVVRYISMGDFVQNVDFFLIGVWTASIFLNISLLVFLSTNILAEFFSLKDPKPLYSSVVWFITAYAIQMAKSTTEFEQFLNRSWSAFSILIECIPIVYLLIYWVKLKRGNAALKPASSS